MSLDFIGHLLLTCVSAVAIIVPAIWYVRRPGGAALLVAHILWFAIVVALAGSGVLSWGSNSARRFWVSPSDGRDRCACDAGAGL